MLVELFVQCEGVHEVKIIKDKATGIPAGYGFAKFTGQHGCPFGPIWDRIFPLSGDCVGLKRACVVQATCGMIFR